MKNLLISSVVAALCLSLSGVTNAQSRGLVGVPLSTNPALDTQPTMVQLVPLDPPSLEPTLPTFETPEVYIPEKVEAVSIEDIESVDICVIDPEACEAVSVE